MAEISTGVGSAAWLADQAFGVREMIGTALVPAPPPVEFGGADHAARLTPQSAPRG